MAKPIKLYGKHAVLSVLEHRPLDVLELFVADGSDLSSVEDILNQANAVGVTLQRAAKAKLEKMAGSGQHQGVVASVRTWPSKGDADLEVLLEGQKAPLILVLDSITDPHNLGACLRNADAFGVDAVVVPRDRSVSLTPAVAKVAVGAAETVPLFQVTNLRRALEKMKSAGVWVYGTAIGDRAVDVSSLEMSRPMALVLGAEGKGLREGTMVACDHLMYLPMQGWVDSLNVSVAAGVFLADVKRS